MKTAFRIMGILLAIGAFVGCSSDDPVEVIDPPGPPLPTNPSGTLGIYADIEGLDASISDTGGMVQVFVVHKVANGATASEFKVEAPAGWTPLSYAPVFPVTITKNNDVHQGVSIGYGTCMNEAFHVLSVAYMTPGTGTPGQFRILNHDYRSTILVADCNYVELTDGVGETTDTN
jgi:hypothetical protein